MASKSKSILGIELHDHQVRIVELRLRGDESVVSQVTTLTPESGYMAEWGFVAPEKLGIQIRAALQWAEIAGRDAVFGLPAWMCAVRPLSVPPVPEQELHFIVEGEIEHSQIFRRPGASFDLVRIHDSKLTEPSGRNVLLMGAEEKTLDGVKAIAQAAGLKLLAVEPTHAALYRVAHTQSLDPIVVVTLSETNAQISLLDHGRLALHRALDLGGSIFDVPEQPGATEMPPLELDAASNLAVELRRSIDYYSREMFDSPRPQVITLACAHPNAPILAQWLSAALRMTVNVADLRNIGPKVKLARTVSDQDAMRYVAAYGLALRDRELVPEVVPVVDLFTNEHVRIAARDDQRRKFRVLMTAAFGFLAAGAVVATIGTLTARQAAAALERSQQNLANAQREQQAKQAEANHRAEQLSTLQAQGVPARATIQAIVKTLPKDVGLADVRMNPLSTDLSGETLSESSIIRMSDALRNDPRFLSVSLTWFERVNPAIPEAGERFRMSLVMAPPAPPPAPAAGGTP